MRKSNKHTKSSRRLRLAGKVCLITGGARGIGATSARLFAEEGAQVAIADLKDDLGTKVAAAIIRRGGQAMYFHCDVTSSTDVAAMVRAVLARFGRIDVLFNNAGTAIVGDVVALSEEDWDRTFAINVKSMFLCSKHVVPVMKKNGGGSIIHMGSESGLIGLPMHPAYCSSKGAVVNLTRSMAIGHAADRIRVNCLCPGTIPTPLYKEFLSTLPNQAEVETFLKREHPLGLGSESEIANAALFLASDESSYMTGAPMIVDGGYTAK
jgi:NAD(P)-dependent dehydrogenase (short-subunit alcohol dehydrogenase family)